jgi:hypothetical protein
MPMLSPESFFAYSCAISLSMPAISALRVFSGISVKIAAEKSRGIAFGFSPPLTAAR